MRHAYCGHHELRNSHCAVTECDNYVNKCDQHRTVTRVIICPSCRGQGHVEGNDCSCKGWGRLKVGILGPCELKTVPLSEDAPTREAYQRILQDRASKGR
jgi:hypothetical protein